VNAMRHSSIGPDPASRESRRAREYASVNIKIHSRHRTSDDLVGNREG